MVWKVQWAVVAHVIVTRPPVVPELYAESALQGPHAACQPHSPCQRVRVDHLKPGRASPIGDGGSRVGGGLRSEGARLAPPLISGLGRIHVHADDETVISVGGADILAGRKRGHFAAGKWT
jgi:hypothetical protein